MVAAYVYPHEATVHLLMLDPFYATRRRLNAGLVVAGALAGGVFGLALTRLGKVVAEAPPGTLKNYLWNAAVFATLGAVVTPLVAWSSLRRAPLWRIIAEPLAFAVAGAGVAVLFNVPILILVAPPLGLALGFNQLAKRYPDPDRAVIADGRRNEVGPGAG